MPGVIIYKLDDEFVYVTLAASYEEALRFAQDAFPRLKHVEPERISFSIEGMVVIFPQEFKRATIRIAPMAWPDVMAGLGRGQLVNIKVHPVPERTSESRRGGDRIDHAQGDSCPVAGGSEPPRASTEATVDSFGNIDRTAAPSNLEPVSVFAHGKKDPKHDSTPSLSRTNSSSDMFIVLGESDGSKPAQPLSATLSRKARTPPPSSDGPQPQRRKLMLPSHSKPASEEAPLIPEDASAEDKLTMSKNEVNRRISEDLTELLGVRDLNEADVYFTSIPPEYRFRLVERCVSAAVQSKESDAQLVAEFFHRAFAGGMCPPKSFEKGFALVAEDLDDIAIDAPKAYELMAMMLEGSGLGYDAQTRIAITMLDPQKLLDLLS